MSLTSIVDLSFSIIFGLLATILVLWKVTQFVNAKSPIALVAGPAKDHWLTGNYDRLFRDGFEYNLNLVQKYGGVVKIFALFGQEQLYISDPQALHHIVVKEQDVFEETDMFIMTNQLIFGEGLISTLGDQHTKQRKMLNPVFSTANMRELLPTIQPIASKLLATLVSQLPSDGGGKEIDLLPWMSRGALEYISQATLGYSFDALDADTPNEYAEAVKNLAPAALKLLFFRPFVPFIVRNFSLYWRNKMVDWLPIKPLKEMRRISEIMDATSRKIFEEKKAALSHTTVDLSQDEAQTEDMQMRRKDIMSILLQANNLSSEAERLSESEIIGQMSTIIFAGFDNTANAICRILYILAREPKVQAQVRREIRQAKLAHAESGDTWEGGRWQDADLPYNVLMGLPYLDAILRETLRVHPPTSLLRRTTKRATSLPLARPVRSASGSMMSSIPVPEKTAIIISILAANHNKDVWGEDASVWRPERWLSPSGELHNDMKQTNGLHNASKEHSQNNATGDMAGAKRSTRYPGVYGSMMTFLGGGRACIAFKFAEMEIKQVLVTLLSTMHFALPSTIDGSGTPKEIYWKMNGLQVPVVRPPTGDDQTPQVPLYVKLISAEDDFI